MINITSVRAQRLYQAEFDRQMSILENTFFNEIKPLLGRQFYNAADLVAHGVLMDGINHAVDLGRRRWMTLFEKHYRRVAGTFSKTNAKQPIFSSINASSFSFSASSSSLALTVYVPNL